MSAQPSTPPLICLTPAQADAWQALLAAAAAAGAPTFASGTQVPEWLQWQADSGRWSCTLPEQDARRPLLDLYLPLCSASGELPLTIAHVGQSLDGYIATAAGDSFYVNGPDNILHLHRLRALCDAVIVGAATVATDNPRLTVRLASGTHPLRVILDPSRRLAGSERVFTDGLAPTLRVVPRAAGVAIAADELAVERGAEGLDLPDLLRQLRARGCSRVFVEGGGITVTSFLRAGLLDRLHIAIAPLLIGEGRRALRLPAQPRLQDCLRLSARVFAMGSDTLYDCDLREPVPADTANRSV